MRSFLLCSLDVRETPSVHIQGSAGDVLGWWPSLVTGHTESVSPRSSCLLPLLDGHRTDNFPSGAILGSCLF